MHISEMTDEAFGAYLAGFTDGEGYVTTKDRGVRIVLANCVLSVLEDIRDRLGYGVIRSQQQKEHWTLRHVYVVSNAADATDFLRRARPYMQIKGPAADAVLAKIETRRGKVAGWRQRNDAVRAAADAGETRRAIAERFGICPSRVSAILPGYNWTQRSETARKRPRAANGAFLPRS